jgi:hypothetical protein
LLISLTAYSQKTVVIKGDTLICFSKERSRHILSKINNEEMLIKLDSVNKSEINRLDSLVVKYRMLNGVYVDMIQNKEDIIKHKTNAIKDCSKKLDECHSENKKLIEKNKKDKLFLLSSSILFFIVGLLL